MMKFVSALTKKYEIPTVASLNTIMVDGTGMCGACRITVGGKTKFVCVDGRSSMPTRLISMRCLCVWVLIKILKRNNH